jgi:hypothetical protein
MTAQTSGRGSKLALALVLVVLCMAPTPGDVGGCGQEPQELDAPVFFATKQEIDCDRCRECGILTESCRRACDEDEPPEQAFPEGCRPLVHDGEVCLRALRAAACDEYAEHMADSTPTAPSECNFCPPRSEP